MLNDVNLEKKIVKMFAGFKYYSYLCCIKQLKTKRVMVTLSCALISVIVTVYVMLLIPSKNNMLNGKSVDGDSKLKCVELEVTEIDVSFDVKFRKIARYTATVAFFNKKNNKDWVYNKFVFYDEIGKYNVGDKLTITKVIK